MLCLFLDFSILVAGIFLSYPIAIFFNSAILVGYSDAILSNTAEIRMTPVQQICYHYLYQHMASELFQHTLFHNQPQQIHAPSRFPPIPDELLRLLAKALIVLYDCWSVVIKIILGFKFFSDETADSVIRLEAFKECGKLYIAPHNATHDKT